MALTAEEEAQVAESELRRHMVDVAIELDMYYPCLRQRTDTLRSLFNACLVHLTRMEAAAKPTSNGSK